MRIVVAAVVAFGLASCGSPSKPTEEATGSINDASGNNLWVTKQRVDRHSCPSNECGIVGQLFFREAAPPLEQKAGWVRITKYYDASCVGGKSKYVDRGNARCEARNGIVDGNFAEWIRAEDVSPDRPADPALTASVDEKLVSQSDDFNLYRAQFVKITAQLIADGRCTAADFEEMGGWMKSVNEHRDQPVYFTYCGGMTAANKIYINGKTGKVLP